MEHFSEFFLTFFSSNSWLFTLLFISCCINFGQAWKYRDKRRQLYDVILKYRNSNPIYEFICQEVEKTRAALDEEFPYFTNKEFGHLRLAFLNGEKNLIEQDLQGKHYWQAIDKYVKDIVDQSMRINKSAMPILNEIDALKLRICRAVDSQKTKRNAQELKDKALHSLERLSRDYLSGELEQDYIIKKLISISKSLSVYEQPVLTSQKLMDNQVFDFEIRTGGILNEFLHRQTSSKEMAFDLSEKLHDKSSAVDCNFMQSYFDNDTKVQQTIHKLKDEIKQLKSKVRVIHTNRAADPCIETTASDSDKLNAELMSNAEKQIKHLQGVIEDQAKTLLELDHSLVEQNLSSDEAESRQYAEIQQLKNNMESSEQLINLLNSEIHKLQESLSNIVSGEAEFQLDELESNELDRTNNAGQSAAVTQEQNNKLETTQVDVRELDGSVADVSRKRMRAFIKKLYNLDDCYEIGMAFYEMLMSIGMESSILISAYGEVLEFHEYAKIPVTDKTRLNTAEMYLNPTSESNCFTMKLKYISAVLRNENTEEVAEWMLDSLRCLFIVTDAKIGEVTLTKLNQQHERRNKAFIELSRKISAEIDRMLDQHFNEVKTQIRDFSEKVEVLVNRKEVGSTSMGVLQRNRDEIIHRIESDKSLPLKIRRVMSLFVEKLEKSVLPQS